MARYGGRDGCHRVGSKYARLGPNQILQYAVHRSVKVSTCDEITHPFSLSSLRGLIGHPFAHAIWIEEGPDGELVQDADFEEDVEIAEVLWLFVITVRIELGCFGQVLSSCVFVPI